MENLLALKQKIASLSFFSSPFYLKNRPLLIPGAVLVVAVLISVLVTIPQFFKLFETFKRIEELNTKIAFFKNKISALEGIDLELYRKNLDTALIALPVDRNIPGVTGELLVALSGSGMTLNGITFSSSEPESEKITEYNLKIDVSGTEENLKNFLDRVKATPRIIKLSSIDVSKGKSNKLSASVGFVTLYQQLPKNITAVDEPVPLLTPQDSQALSAIEDKVKVLPNVTPVSGATPVKGKLNPFSP